MREKPACLICLLCLLAALPAVAGRTYRLEPVKLKSPFSPFLYLEWSPEPPAEAGTMPPFASPIPVFSSLKLGDRPPMLIAADVVQQEGAARCTVYLDANWNGSLAGERPYPLGPVNLDGTQLIATEEIRLALRYHTDAGDVVGQVAFRLATEPGAEAPYGPPYAMYVEYGRSAVVDLGGTSLRLTVCDANGDAKITAGEGSEGDRCGLDADLLSCPAPQSFSRLSPRLAYGGAYYDLAVRPDGGQITVSPYSGPIARLLVAGLDGAGNSAAVADLSAIGEEPVLIRGPVQGPVSLLPGRYEVAYAIGGPSGAAFGFRVPGPLVLEPDSAARLDCGGPLSLDIGVKTIPVEGNWVLQVAVGARTEAGHRFVGADSDAPGATVVALNLDGEVVAEGQTSGGEVALRTGRAAAGARYVVRVTFDPAGYQAPIVKQVPVTLKAPAG